MKTKSFILAALLLTIGPNVAHSDWIYGSRTVELTDLQTEVIRYDPDFPGKGYLVTFKVYGTPKATYKGKSWTTYVQNQLIDCSDMTYVVVDGTYKYMGKEIGSFNNRGNFKWRSALQNFDNDAGKRVVEFCAW